MKTSQFLAGVAAAALVPAIAAAQEVTLRFSYWVPAAIAPAATGLEPWAASIEEASDGRIDVETYPAQQLGSAPDHYDMARDGIVDIAYVNPGYTAGRFPIFSLVEIPFQISDSVMGSRSIHEWYAPHAETEMSDVHFCLVQPHGVAALHSIRPIHTPDQVAGVNVRPAHATMARFVSMLGGAPVQVPAPETGEALRRGTADAITFPWGGVYDFRMDDVVTEHLDMPFYISAQVLVINQSSYDRLSDENRAVIDSHCTPEWSARIAEGWAEDDANARQRLADDPAHTLYAPTEDEVALWREAAAPLVDAWREDVGDAGDPQAIYDSFVETLEANGARY
ncbi:C4-dicarboxylate ABC transporter [Rhodobacterales bacterium HKCCE2091]|nr:C4-dicarboxylate ABC transporter [Rhodobacterales bacterium HKCCE2091]